MEFQKLQKIIDDRKMAIELIEEKEAKYGILKSEDIPEPFLEIFDGSFRALASGNHRSTSDDWINAFKKIIPELKQCEIDSRHMYWSKQSSCPYCNAKKRSLNRR